MDNAIALGVKPLQLDIATPLLTAAKIRQSQVETQQHEQALKQNAAGEFARGVAVYADKPEFAQKWGEGMDDLKNRGLIDPQSYARMRDNPSPLILKQIIAQTTSPELAFRKEEAGRTQSNVDRAFAEQQRQFNIGVEGGKVPPGFERVPEGGGLRPVPGGPQDPAFVTAHTQATEKPVSVGAGASLVNPRTGEVLHKGDSGMSDTAIEVGARQLVKGDLSGLTNIGRGAQGDQKLTALRNRAAEILINEQGMTADAAAEHLGKQMQAFKASGVGQTTEARTTASREANLNLILKATEAAIPAALEQSDKVERYAGKFVPLNQIIQKGQVMTSDAELKKFGIANLQLAEHWARAMNPTGVMRESDRDMALHFLSTADSKATYKAAVMQIKEQITRERDAIRSGHTSTAPSQPAADPLGLR